MVTEVLPNLYRIEVPLPKNPLKAVNSYVIKGGERFLIIDTGMNREECTREMQSGLEKLGVDLEKADFFITHLHADHLGLAASLATDKSKVYFNEIESLHVGSKRAEILWKRAYALYIDSGFPEDELSRAFDSHPGRRHGLERQLDFTILREGDRIDIGDYSLTCIETPGHSPGHICLYEAEKKLLFSGDHLLFDITPNITNWLGVKNPLKDYLTSLDKLYGFDVALVLPGHREVGSDHRRRIRELQEHHRARLNEIVCALKDGEKNAFQIAPCLSWDVDYGSWELFPPAQKWFAVGETLAHLNYLEEDGVVQREMRGQEIVFSLV